MRKIVLFLLFIMFPLYTLAYTIGDVNGDGEVLSDDYLMIRRHRLETRILTGDELKRADVNGDGKIKDDDYIMIRRIIIGKIPLSTAEPNPTRNTSSKKNSDVPTSISFDKSSGSILSTKTAQLNVTVLPDNAKDKTVKYSTSDASIVTVSNKGVIRGRKAGKATITAKTSNGLEAKYEVTVDKIKILMVGNSKTFRTQPEKYPAVYYKMIHIMENGGFSADITAVHQGGTSLSWKYERSEYYNQMNKSYDVAILQEQTAVVLARADSDDEEDKRLHEKFDNGVKNVVNLLKKNNSNVVIYLRQSWQNMNSDYDTNQKQTNTNVANMVSKYKLKTIRDGEAFMEFKKNYDFTKLYNNCEGNPSSSKCDIKHGSNEGVYLAAACIYRRITAQDPRKLTYYGGLDGDKEISKDDAKILQQVAYDVCK